MKVKELIEELKKQEIQWILLAGFLWLLPPKLVQAFPGHILNIHPALLPKYGGAGMYGRHVHEAVLAADEPNAGSAHGKLTVSIGVAVHTGIVTAEDTAEDLLRLADGRLYEAKAAGRNAVIPRQERPKLAVV